MGYISSVKGNLEAIGPVSSLQEALTALKEYMSENSDYGGYWIQDVFSSEGVEGTFVTIVYDNSGKAYNIGSEIQEVVNILEKLNFKVSGAIYIEGEEPADFSRVLIRDGRAIFQKGIVTINYETA